MLAALAFAWFHSGAIPPGAHGHTTRLACTVLDTAPEDAEMQSRFECDADGGLELAVDATGLVPKVGVRMLLRGRLESFDPPRNPGEPDMRQIEADRGVDARLVSAHVLQVLPAAPLTWRTLLAGLRARALSEFRSRLSEPYASILAGELWGERGALPPELHAEFQETGTVHVLVTAGLHLGVVALLAGMLARLLTVPRALGCGLVAATVWTYAAFSGFHLPSVRAALMISAALAARACGRTPGSWRPYAIALAGIALFKPDAVAGASFALSFSCVGAILLCAGEIAKCFEQTSLPERVREALTLTIATQLGTWPLTASIFLIFAPYAVMANLCVVPLVGFTMLLGGAELCAMHWPVLAQAAANVNSWLLAFIVSSVHTIATLPLAAIPIAPPPVWTIVFYDAMLVLAVWCWKKRARTPALAALLLGIATAVAPPPNPDHRLHVTVLDVGQADGIVIQTPVGETILVDAGGRLERGTGTQSTAEQVGERVVVPFLRRQGVHRIDAVVLSHPHGDHAGGVAPVLRAFGAAEFADGGQRYGGYAYNDALQTANSEHVPIVHPRAGMVWRTPDGVSLTFLGPALPFITGSQNDINNNSVAFVLQYRHFRMLFTGDAGAEAEQRFLNEGIDLRADVLKVGHHGSAYSSTREFIAAVHPRYAIISVGRHNMFGHPAPSTIETLHRFGATVYRTDENGAVTVISDGSHLRTETMLLQ